ncbi:MAG TPA: lytic transglycosylase domain-containing protein, partial [Candidatus Obscuribacterales bacterium]
ALRQQMIYWHALYPFPYMDLIKTWSEKRQLNPLLVVGLIRQESRFEPRIRSIAGAAGLMQLIPTTAASEAKTNNLDKYALENPKDNIQLGTAYLDTTHRHYNNNSMLAVASYNAGPGNVSKWLKERGSLDSDQFVESIPFEETKGYVKNVFGNYWNYLRLYNPEISQQLAKYSPAQPTVKP